MASNIGAKVELAGEREFRKALSEINTGLRTTASELTLVSAKYAENANSVSALTAKNTALQTKLDQQTGKIKTLRSALENAKLQYGETDKRTLQWQRSLNLAETELIKTEKELKDNSEALKQAQKDMEKYGLSADEVAESNRSLGGIIADLADKVGIRLPGNISKAVSSMDQQISAAEKAKLQTAALITVVVGLASAFAKTTIETAKAADEILTLAQTTGLTTDQIQELRYAEELLDVSTETITGSLTRMIRNMNTARRGTGDAAEAFQKLRIRITDARGELRNSEEVFNEAIDALGRVRNETERDAIAMAIFGRSARELNPLIEKGSGALKEFAEQAHEMGYVMSGDTLEAFGRLDDAMQLWDNQITTLKNNLAMVLLPVLTAFFELLNKIDPKILATVAIIGTIATIGITVVKAVGNISTAFSAMNPVMLKTTAIIVGVTAGLIALAAIIAVIIGKSNELDRTMQGIGTSVSGMTNVVNAAPNQVRYSYASGIDYVPSDRVALIHRGEAVIPAHENPYTPAATHARGGGDTYILQVKMSEVDEVYKLVEVFKSMKQKERAGVVMA